MVLKEHQHLEVCWETTPPIQGLVVHSLHQDLVFAIERWCTGLPVNLEPWLPRGEDFTSRVRRACASIPWGETRTYGQLAQSAGSPQASRAVGQAMRRNPLPLLIPCHRVVGATGLGGYAGKDQNGPQLARKRAILAFEQDVRQSEVGSI
ncbi:MAG: hypothetical protein CMJ37_02220 [Phycisphaerae bacterium]|nr:hypothetical protein [Phycisphaerae bacterium]